MRFAITAASLSLVSSALAITITQPTSGTEWDFSTPKTIKFTSDANDPSVISIILRTQDGSFQTKLADNVKTSTGEYTTQPNPSISNGSDYEIEIIDSSGELAVSPTFTVEKGASTDGTTSSSSASSTSTTSSSSSSSSSSTTTSSSSTSRSATSTSTSSSSSTGTTLATSASSTSSSNSTATTSTAQLSTGAASSTFNAPQGVVALLGAALALLYV
ncbi:hypothetical protein ASPNIDRAFT_40876 [Aspergillus niger ATCC 1015]|uniref:Yeast cell wall synthesis Kre9/Knh1-like N-terminal domain-containing protein n=1 Tax=Aspergillus niger (strain ATCC 1015 / CBS 113.46 / FGSC A1144 / LSHB Ac4 / NCTC 3858a / NRRL 328 / USDA 3528.7) TaxID=380704 RepID=G3XX84_ASPNA|nr:hypothetical protein ASPNIDRAFT_40876 [Aspergillus niger ATCC 1015]